MASIMEEPSGEQPQFKCEITSLPPPRWGLRWISTALMFKGSYNLAFFGLDDVTAYALYTHGWGAVDPVTKSPVFQLDEYDLDLQWRPKKGLLEGLWCRVRFGHADSRDVSKSGFPVNDIRFIVNYDFELL